MHMLLRLFYTPAVASVIALVDDLMFLSRVREAARSAALEVRTVRTTADLLEAARGGAALLVVDFDSRRLPWAEALASLRADPALATLPVIGFLSHVNADAARKARDVGGCQILARSAFVRDLPQLLAAAAPPAPLELK
jgi:DNA-binding NtrC family response regulator